MKDNEDSFLCVQDTCPGKEKRDVNVKSSWASISDSVDDVNVMQVHPKLWQQKFSTTGSEKVGLISVISLLILR